MRRILPAMILVFSALWSFSSFALDDLAAIMRRRGCSPSFSAGGDVAQSRTCFFAAHGLCAYSNVAGCAAYGFPQPGQGFTNQAPPTATQQVQPFNFGSNPDASSFMQKYQGMQQDLARLQADAQRCCNGAGCPNQLGGDALAASNAIAAAGSRPPSGGVHATQNQMADQLNKQSIRASGLTGLCVAKAEQCGLQYQQAAEAITPASCTGGDCQQAMSKAKTDLMKKADACRKMQNKLTQQNATNSNQAGQQVGNQASGTGANPNGSGGSGGSGGGNDRVADGSQAGGPGGGSGAGGAGGGDMGKMLGAMAPLLAAAMQQKQQEQQQQQQQPPAPTATDCSAKDAYGNPVLAGCSLSGGTDSFNPKTGTAEARPAAASADKFNLPDNSDQNSSPGPVGGGEGKPATPITTKPVANGGGGGIPGGAGGGGAASLGGGANGPQGAPPKSTSAADILHGEGGGATLAQMAQNMNMQTGGGGGGFDYGGGGGGSFERLKLADFLPGGSKFTGGTSALRGLAGLDSPIQIQSKTVNIWNRISEHFRTRCAQGLLRDCGP